MPCNCSKSGKKMQYIHTDSSGKTTTYDSEVRARAAQIKTGGSWRAVSA